jgi:pilus assembly protein CpaD
MSATFLRHLAISAVTAAVMLGLAGCTPVAKGAGPLAAAPKHFDVVYSAARWPVYFAPGSSALGAGEKAALNGFVAQLRVGGAKRLQFEWLPQDGGADSALVARRRAVIAQNLVGLGLRDRSGLQAEPAAVEDREAGPGQNMVVVKIGVSRATVSGCPDYSKLEEADGSNLPPSNFGCATLLDLATTVNDPTDLVQGAPAGNADGTFAASGVAAYRAGKFSGTSSSSSSGGSSSGSSSASSSGGGN